MAKSVPTEEATEEVFIPLHAFAQANALKYGIELMGGFYHVQEKANHFADTEQNWHKLIKEFAVKEVK